MNTFVLSFNPFDSLISSEQVNEIVRSHREVEQWYFPFAGTCIFKSSKSVALLAPSFRALLNGAPFLLSEISPQSTGGAQDQYVWDWLNTSQLPRLPSKN
jgi:hypothetical protein